jgi:uncharacterized RDD family membrane protein YckC
MLDTCISVETPEGVDLPLYPASILPRILAFLTDFLIRSVVMIVLSIALGVAGRTGAGILLIVYFLLEWFYPVFFEVWRNGQTPGKKRMGLRVVYDDGTPITFAGSLLRNLLRFVDFLPMFYATGIITSFTNRSFKRVGDLAAGTLVVYNPEAYKQPELDVEGQQALTTNLSTEEQKAIIAFAERSNTLSQERQAELADLLKPLLRNPNSDPVQSIKQVANGLVGRA